MIKLVFSTAVVLVVLSAAVAKASAADYEVAENDREITISTPELQAVVRKKGYVTGIAGGSFVDKKTGFHDAGHGLDIVDWIMEPGSDEAYRDKLPNEMVYRFGNTFHGNIPKRSIEGPQICTQAKELAPVVVRGKDFVAVKQSYKYKTAAPGKKTGSTWTQWIVIPAGQRYFISSDRIDAVNSGPAMFLRVDMPGHIKHQGADTFSEVYLESSSSSTSKTSTTFLKSMVLQDLGGGRVSTVTYGSQDPITKTLKTFAIDLTSNPTLAQLLGQVRGEKVELDAPNSVSGTILGVETRKQKVGDDVVEVEMLNLLTVEGLRSVKLESVGRIKLANEKLDDELRQALAVLALGHDNDKKSVTLEFLGNGKRPVRVGYIQEAPIWKTSYRLLLSDNDPPFLQGWAIVENTTEEDWNGVSLTLMSGRPISFVMNLYQPLYVPRPVIEPELFASLRPQVYGQDLDRKQAEFAERARAEEQLGGRMLAKRRAGLRDAAAAAPAAGGMAGQGAFFGDKSGIALDRGVESLAEAGNVGELFQYAIDTPVTLARQKSAMLPIINDSVMGEKLSIYNENVQAKHPLNGLRLKNTSDLYLMQGPITVFDDGAYAGDAQIEDLPPGSERLLSYALDLKTEVASEAKQSPQQLVKCRLVTGVLHTSNKLERRRTYTVKNSGRDTKKVLVEYANEPGWTLLAPKEPTEKTRDRYRFAVDAKPGEAAKLELAEEQTIAQQVELTNIDDKTIRYYMNAKVVSDKVKEALADVIRRKQEISDLAGQKQQLEQQIAAINEEQTRIRQNMQQLDRNSDLYRRYVKKFSEQEDEVEKLRTQIASRTGELAKRQTELDGYLGDLNLD